MQEVYDVYAAHQPLEEGEEKHIISVFVADESGIINRVAGVFARRGAPQLKLNDAGRSTLQDCKHRLQSKLRLTCM